MLSFKRSDFFVRPKSRWLISLVGIAVVTLAPAATVVADDAPDALGANAAPLPDNLSTFVKNNEAAKRLGKALFWDMQVGSDGQTACATCHYNAGVDARTHNNTVNPGFNGTIDVALPLDIGDFPFTHDDVIGSEGVIRSTFDSVGASPIDSCIHPVQGRQNTGRNSPSNIMAIFNDQNFWDGRASEVFNGVDINGDDSSAKIWVKRRGKLRRVTAEIEPASAASQAVGPPNSGVEMSCDGRQWRDLGRKLINSSLMPLGQQKVHSQDSLLGGLADPVAGLTDSYRDMIRDAFRGRYTSDLMTSNGFTQIEENMSLFFGLSILLYNSELMPNQSKFDEVQRGNDSFTASEERGLDIFYGDGRCDSCHGGTEFTNASSENGGNGDAFANIAVRPNFEDQGQGDGEFKTPTLRGIAWTGPYMHTGGLLTLRQVVDFYDRGGDFPSGDTDSDIRDLGLSETDKNDLVAFMLTLGDERVACERAPFDRPAIDITNGPSLTAVGQNGRPAGTCITPYLNPTNDPGFHFTP